MQQVMTTMLMLVAVGPAWAADFVWLEGEAPASKNMEVKGAPSENAQWLSGGQWLSVLLDPAQASKIVPPEGVLLGYQFQAPAPGKYEVWNRIGMEFTRSPFDWRIDAGAWQAVQPTDFTTDLVELGLWTQVAWLKMGAADLAAGPHTLQIRVRPTPPDPKNPDKNAGKIVYCSDALCLYPGSFYPNGQFKPGADWRTDEDKQAAANIFQMKPTADPAQRSEVSLGGLWEVCRWDELEVADRVQPVKTLPEAAASFWKAIQVPGNKYQVKPELAFAHRLVYRTRVNVPAELAGHSFYLRIPSESLMASVLVNGQYCGWTKAPFAPFECDVTKAIRPGQVNEVCVVLKDNYYAFSEKKTGKNIRFQFNTPSTWVDGRSHVSQLFDFPIGSAAYGVANKAGLLERPPTLVAAGAVYTTDVFAIPSVKNKQLTLELTLLNPTPADQVVTVTNEIVPAHDGPAEKTFAPQEVKLAAGEEKVVKLTEAWAAPKLWWPDDPNLYQAVTKISLGGKVIDTRRTRFGFREWAWAGSSFKLNGVRWQFFSDDYPGHPRDLQAVEAEVKDMRRAGMNIIRAWAANYADQTIDETISYMDEQGIVVRRSGIFDAMGANYLHKLAEGSELFDNWIAQLQAQVKAERNHPSLLIWSLENEVTFINARNLGISAKVEPHITRAAQAVMALDPTRPVMVDGGNCLMDKSLPVNGVHYGESEWRDYPDEAYTLENAYQAHLKDTSAWGKQPWELVKDRPIFMGEAFFLRGYPPSAYAQFGGEACFAGRGPAVKQAAGLFTKMLSEGYRWHGVAATSFSVCNADADLQHNSWQPVCALCREWNFTFAGGAQVERRLKVFNSTQHPDPVTFAWELQVNGKRVGGESKEFNIPPGEAVETDIRLNIPPVSQRTGGQLILTCIRNGKEVFRETKPVAIIDPSSGPKPQLSAEELAVLDPVGPVQARLKARGVAFTPLTRFEDLPPKAKVLVLGPDALSARDATDPKWMSFAAKGGRVLVLDQKNPLQHMAIPADLVPTTYVGRIAFAENLDHPVFAGLGQEDFFTWSKDHVVYRNVYKKAARGAISLAHCDQELGYSALSQCPVNDGLMLLCQLLVGTKLDSDPVAQRLFDNLLAYAATYAPDRKNTAVVVNSNSALGKLLANSGLKYDPAADLLSALGDGKHQIVVAEATPANLKTLAGNLPALKSFTTAGGWLMLCGLTPVGLADFNRIVGVEHLLRPFEMERVTPAPLRDPLMSGISGRDVGLLTAEKIFGFSGDTYPVNDEFTWLVDLDDIAPFCAFPGAKAGDYAAARKLEAAWPRNTVNGLTSADGWKLIYYMKLDPQTNTARLTVTLPRPEEIVEFALVPNLHYAKPVKVNLYFDDDPQPQSLALKPLPERQDFPLQPRKASKLTVELAEFENGDKPTTGIDNMWIKVRRPDDFPHKVKPLLNIGGLVKYPLGPGGIVLNQLNLLDREAVPVNAQKKMSIVAALLRNLGAQFAAAKLLVAGEGLKYAPVVLEERCNQYLTSDQGWFDAPRDLKHLPVGLNTFAGVQYLVRDFKTSPLPSCLMLSGPGVKGKMPAEVTDIPVARKADALYFLHAFKQTKMWTPPNKGDSTPPVLFKYVVHYANGQSVDVPVRCQEGAGHWMQKDPQGLKQAIVAWAAPFPDDPAGEQAVLYSMQWNNPNPQEEIKSLDLLYDPTTRGQYGVPALLGLTAATRIEQGQ